MSIPSGLPPKRSEDDTNMRNRALIEGRDLTNGLGKDLEAYNAHLKHAQTSHSNNFWQSRTVTNDQNSVDETTKCARQAFHKISIHNFKKV